MAEINVPKPPAKAFNPDRPASDLLKQQVKHLEWAVRHAGQRREDFHKVKYVRTEAEAANRMKQLLPRLSSAAELPFSTVTVQEAAASAAAPNYRKRSTPQPKAKKKKKSKAAKRSKRPKRNPARSKRSGTSKAKR